MTPHKQLKEEAETVMLHLMTLVQYTAVSSISAVFSLFVSLHFPDKLYSLCPNLCEVFDRARSLRGKKNTFETCGLQEVIEIFVAMNHFIKGKMGIFKLNCHMSFFLD